MSSLAAHHPLSRLLLIAASLVAGLAFAQTASASPCPGADTCPWSQVDTFGDVGNGEFRAPLGIAADGSGNLYVLEQDTNRVQKLDANGAFLAKWGAEGTAAGEFDIATDIAVDAAGGGVYVVEAGNERLQKFDTDGNFVSAWGWGVADGSAAYQVCTSNCRAGTSGGGSGQFNGPDGIATDGINVYVADLQNKRIQKFDLNGAKVGQWAIPGAQKPERVALAGGKVYVSTRADTVWRFDTNGAPDNTWDGDGVMGSSGTGAGQFSHPQAVAVDGSGVYVADSGNHRVTKFDSSGAFATTWGTRGSGAGQFNGPFGLLAIGGSVWVADSYNHRLQRFGQTGAHQLTVGSAAAAGEFYWPSDVATIPSGGVYVADWSGHDIQRLDGSGNPIVRWDTGLGSPDSVTATADGVYATDSSSHVSLYSSIGTVLNQFGGFGSGQGQLNFPGGTTADAAGNLYVADRSNHRVQKFGPTGTPLGGFGSGGSGDGQFQTPRDVAIDSSGNVYVADGGNNRIEKFGPTGAFLAKWGGFGSGDGQFRNPAGVAVDAAGHIFVSDNGNNRIQEFDTNGGFIAKWGAHGDGPGELSGPSGLSADSAGAVWVADTHNHRIVRFCCSAAHGGSPPESGEAPPSGPGITADTTAPRITLSGRAVQRSRRVDRRGLALRIATSEGAKVTLSAVLSKRDARRLGLRGRTIAHSTADLTAAGTRALRLRVTARARRALLGTRKVRIAVRASAADPAGNRSRSTLAITVTR